MKEYNGAELKKLLDEAEKQGAGFRILTTTVQGLTGVFVSFDKSVQYDDDIFNSVLIEEIK